MVLSSGEGRLGLERVYGSVAVGTAMMSQTPQQRHRLSLPLGPNAFSGDGHQPIADSVGGVGIEVFDHDPDQRLGA